MLLRFITSHRSAARSAVGLAIFLVLSVQYACRQCFFPVNLRIFAGKLFKQLLVMLTLSFDIDSTAACAAACVDNRNSSHIFYPNDGLC